MCLRAHQRCKDGKDHTYWSLVETVRTANGPRQRTLCYLGELNSSAQGRWLKTVEVFNQQGEAEQLKLFPSHVEPPADDPQVARVLVNRVRLERTRQFGACFLGGEMWKRLELDRFFEQAVQGWIEKHLRLQVNAAKSGVGRSWERKFLGFRVNRERQIEAAPESLERFKTKVRAKWRSGQSRTSNQLREAGDNWSAAGGD